MAYTRFQEPDRVTGGFVELGGPLQHHTGELLVYVGSDDIDSDAQKAVELGGKVVVPKKEIPRTGWFASLRSRGWQLSPEASPGPNVGSSVMAA